MQYRSLQEACTHVQVKLLSIAAMADGMCQEEVGKELREEAAAIKATGQYARWLEEEAMGRQLRLVPPSDSLPF